MKCPSRSCKPPSVRSFTRAFKAFRKKYPRVRLIQPWNEVNSPTQPTGKNPRRAAEFYNVVRANCRRCTVPAARAAVIQASSRAGSVKIEFHGVK